ncbi:hypothetical protein [Idiomarina sp.]|uniref:hypothetical protein n=1 Tax=Idiomarina sp. TaxID=1874361 RepID=UPI0025C2D70A|nr:hypothetical protein [Idiomarina sp.]
MLSNQLKTLLKSFFSALTVVVLVFAIMFLVYDNSSFSKIEASDIPNDIKENNEQEPSDTENLNRTASRTRSQDDLRLLIFGGSLVVNCLAFLFTLFWAVFTHIKENKVKNEQQKLETIDKFWLREVILKHNILPVLENLKSSQVHVEILKNQEKTQESIAFLKDVFGDQFLAMRNELLSLKALPGFDTCYSELKDKLNKTQDYVLSLTSDKEAQDEFERILIDLQEDGTIEITEVPNTQEFSPQEMYLEIIKVISSKQLNENGFYKK